MDWAGRPKRFRGELRRWALGGRVNALDPDLADAMWLVGHPSWSWHDLQSTPADVIDLMARAESALASARKSSQ